MAWIAAFVLFFAVFVALSLLDGASWHTALWSTPWKALAALIGAWLCDALYRFLTWRPGRPRDAAPPPDAGRPE